jgi:hypothetical protein
MHRAVRGVHIPAGNILLDLCVVFECVWCDVYCMMHECMCVSMLVSWLCAIMCVSTGVVCVLWQCCMKDFVWLFNFNVSYLHMVYFNNLSYVFILFFSGVFYPTLTFYWRQSPWKMLIFVLTLCSLLSCYRFILLFVSYC